MIGSGASSRIENDGTSSAVGPCTTCIREGVKERLVDIGLVDAALVVEFVLSVYGQPNCRELPPSLNKQIRNNRSIPLASRIVEDDRRVAALGVYPHADLAQSLTGKSRHERLKK